MPKRKTNKKTGKEQGIRHIAKSISDSYGAILELMEDRPGSALQRIEFALQQLESAKSKLMK